MSKWIDTMCTKGKTEDLSRVKGCVVEAYYMLYRCPDIYFLIHLIGT